MQTSGRTCREIVKSYSAVITREGGGPSIPETPVIEARNRGVLDPRMRGEDDGGALRRDLPP